MMTLLRYGIVLLVLAWAAPLWAARGFGTTDGAGTTDAVTTGLTSHASSATVNYSVWVIRTGLGGGTFGRIFAKEDTALTRALFDNNGANYTFGAAFTVANGNWTFPLPSNDVWHHVLITYDAGSTVNVPIIYVDGSAVTVTPLDTPVGTWVENADPYVIGNRTAGTRNWNGEIAEFAVWINQTLTSGNATSLAGGAPADSIATPLDYWKICGDASPEPNVIGGRSSGTVTGTLKTAHPFANCTRRSGTVLGVYP